MENASVHPLLRSHDFSSFDISRDKMQELTDLYNSRARVFSQEGDPSERCNAQVYEIMSDGMWRLRFETGYDLEAYYRDVIAAAEAIQHQPGAYEPSVFVEEIDQFVRAQERAAASEAAIQADLAKQGNIFDQSPIRESCGCRSRAVRACCARTAGRARERCDCGGHGGTSACGDGGDDGTSDGGGAKCGAGGEREVSGKPTDRPISRLPDFFWNTRRGRRPRRNPAAQRPGPANQQLWILPNAEADCP
jgi:hypothetical protein